MISEERKREISLGAEGWINRQRWKKLSNEETRYKYRKVVTLAGVLGICVILFLFWGMSVTVFYVEETEVLKKNEVQQDSALLNLGEYICKSEKKGHLAETVSIDKTNIGGLLLKCDKGIIRIPHMRWWK